MIVLQSKKDERDIRMSHYVGCRECSKREEYWLERRKGYVYRDLKG